LVNLLNKALTFFFGVLLFVIPASAVSQISHNPVSMGLGGGGTSYITGYDALFINPANLQLREKEYSAQISLLESGVYLDTPLRIRNTANRFDELNNLFQEPGNARFTLDETRRELIISRHYNNNRLARQFRSLRVVNWFGMKWFGRDRSYAVALRTRQSSRFTVGRGFYDASPVESESLQQIDRSLTHDYQMLHELSFGYSESFGFLSGLFPRISRFIVGIAPKVVLSGPMYSTQYLNTYTRQSETDPWMNNPSYRFKSTGIFSESAQKLMAGRDPVETRNEIDQFSELFSPTGLGAALDLGITYIYTFGDDLSLLRRGEELTEKSLRLSLSVTDLGLIHYFDNPYRVATKPGSIETKEPGSLPDTYYAGALLQDFEFLQNVKEHPLESDLIPDRNSFQELLPTAVQTGILFQINRIKLMGDFRLGLSQNAFQTTKLTSFIGAEIRPLTFLPIRAGTRLATDLPGYFSFGAGLETRSFDVNAAMQFRSKATGPTIEPVAASVVALKLYIP